MRTASTPAASTRVDPPVDAPRLLDRAEGPGGELEVRAGSARGRAGSSRPSRASRAPPRRALRARRAARPATRAVPARAPSWTARSSSRSARASCVRRRSRASSVPRATAWIASLDVLDGVTKRVEELDCVRGERVVRRLRRFLSTVAQFLRAPRRIAARVFASPSFAKDGVQWASGMSAYSAVAEPGPTTSLITVAVARSIDDRVQQHLVGPLGIDAEKLARLMDHRPVRDRSPRRGSL